MVFKCYSGPFKVYDTCVCICNQELCILLMAKEHVNHEMATGLMISVPLFYTPLGCSIKHYTTLNFNVKILEPIVMPRALVSKF